MEACFLYMVSFVQMLKCTGRPGFCDVMEISLLQEKIRFTLFGE